MKELIACLVLSTITLLFSLFIKSIALFGFWTLISLLIVMLIVLEANKIKRKKLDDEMAEINKMENLSTEQLRLLVAQAAITFNKTILTLSLLLIPFIVSAQPIPMTLGATATFIDNSSVVIEKDSVEADTYIYKLKWPVCVVDSFYVTDSLLRNSPTVAFSNPLLFNFSTTEWLEENEVEGVTYLFSRDGNSHLELIHK
jgi:hypothetical protein